MRGFPGNAETCLSTPLQYLDSRVVRLSVHVESSAKTAASSTSVDTYGVSGDVATELSGISSDSRGVSSVRFRQRDKKLTIAEMKQLTHGERNTYIAK